MTRTFQDLWASWSWRSIRNCPGRFVLAHPGPPLSVEELLGCPCVPKRFSSPQAKDPILVISLKDGGIISYLQTDGRFIHTLNTSDGFVRKLAHLGILLPGQEGDKTQNGDRQELDRSREEKSNNCRSSK